MQMQAFKETVLLAALCASAVTAQPTLHTIEAHQRTFFPQGKGPFPTVVAVPGCSGVSLDGPATDAGRPGDEADRLFRRHYARMADRLRDGGFGVVLVDYLTAEGVVNTCSGRDVWLSTVPVLVLLGEADDITPPESCDQILRRLPDGTEVEVRRYAAARHGFDFTEGPEVLSIGGGMTVGRNPSAGEEAWEEIFAFLSVRPPG